MKRINNILVDLCRDMWSYVSYGIFSVKNKRKGVGSSAMPHKIKPIDFENAEGKSWHGKCNIWNFLHPNCLYPDYNGTLRTQPYWRNLGVAFAHTIMLSVPLKKGWSKLVVNDTAIYGP